MRGRTRLSASQRDRTQSSVVALLAVCLLLGVGIYSVAQQSDTAPAETPTTTPQTHPEPTGPMPEVRLEAHNGKTNFMMGERIQLDLVFRNTTGNSYTVNTTQYGDFSEQKLEIEPSTGWFQWRGPSGHDYGSSEPLDAKEQRVPVVLNEGFVFREPGHYEIQVTTGRLNRGSGMKTEWLGPITTNAIGIELTPMPQEVEAATVRSLLAEIASSTPHTREAYLQHAEAYERLATLQGDEALHAKIKLIMDEDEEMRSVSSEALASTRNLPLQLSLLQAAWKDTTHAPPYDLAGELEMTRQLMRREMMPGWTMVVLPKEDDATRTMARERAADVASLIASLPARSGQNRADTLYLLFETMPLTSQQKDAIKPALIEEFPYMNSTQQAMLLETARPPLRDPVLIPSLRAMLDRLPTDQDAIEPLIELDPKGAKSYVVRAICNAKSFIPLDKVARLPDASLPEVDGCLSELLHSTPTQSRDQFTWGTRVMLAARFATAAIVPTVRDAWHQQPKNQFADAAVLAFLMRFAPAEAVASLKADVTFNSNAFFSIDEVFKACHAAYPPELRVWLLDLVKNGNEEMARAGAYQLSKHGRPEDRAVLEARLKSLRDRRSSTASHVDSDTSKSAYAEGRDSDVRLEADLVVDLRTSPIWFVNNAEAAELAHGCASTECIHMGDPRNPDVPFTEEDQ